MQQNIKMTRLNNHNCPLACSDYLVLIYFYYLAGFNTPKVFYMYN